MSKLATSSTMILLVLLISCSAFSRAAARPLPQPQEPDAGQETSRVINRPTNGGVEADDDLCNGVGEDECRMMRRELVAHLDYIYTQKTKP